MFLPPRSLAALIAALVALAVIAWLSYDSLVSRSAAAEALNHTTAVQQQTYLFLSELGDAETGQRGYLLTGNEAYLEPYERARDTLRGELEVLREMTLDNEVQQRRVAEIEPMLAAKLTELGETIDRRRAGDEAGALALVSTDRGAALMERIRESVHGMLDAEQRTIASRTAEWEDTVRSSTYVVFGGIGVLVAMILAVGVFASRDYRRVVTASWVRRVEVALATALQGDVTPEQIGERVLAILIEALDAPIGAVYEVRPDRLRRIAGHALPASAEATASVRPGESLVGQAARGERVVHLRELPRDYLPIGSGLGASRPRELVIAPARADGVTYAVIELGFLRAVAASELDALELVADPIAVAIRTARDRARRDELLEETQRQAEELQAQQEELQASNEELAQQSSALQRSQVDLERQQTELEQINVQLEHQTRSLAEQRDELAHASIALQRSNDYKSQFLANVSHELRTPLNSTLILAKLLADNRDTNLTRDQVEYARTIYNAGNDLLALINDILDLSKIEAGMLEVRVEPVKLARLCDDLASTFQPIAGQKRLELAFHLADDAPTTIDTDPTRIQQILTNLIANALKFTEHGGVTVEVARAGERVTFAVRDTGIGIPADQHAAIFEPFCQADGATTRKFGGTGLGLSISRDLARLLGGDLAVESAPGRGSTFRLALPIASAAVAAGPPVLPLAPIARDRTPDAPPVEPGALPAAPFPDDRERIAPGSRSLLVVEDDLAFARVLYDLAHELEFAVLVAASAEDGLALARHYRPSAVVLDVGLPDRSGLAVLDALKRNARTRHIPVHVVSVSDYTRTALEMGAAGYALKPVERAQLIDAIKHLEAKFTQKLRRVLIVEDDPVLRDSTARLLAADDVETITAGTTAEALGYLAAGSFDCIVLDLSLPDRSGVEMLEDMAKGGARFPPVIVYTGRSLSHEQVHELQHWARSIVIKGARSPERLLDEVTLFLHQVESELPPERQRMLRDARDREAVFEGRRILIAEDDVRNLFALSSVLEPKGARVEIARNGREAVQHLQRDPDVDLVLMDIMMPEMDGLAATRAIRSEPRFAKLPIIALTAKAMADDRERCLEAGANDYIAKPIDVDKLVSLARVWIRK